MPNDVPKRSKLNKMLKRALTHHDLAPRFAALTERLAVDSIEWAIQWRVYLAAHTLLLQEATRNAALGHPEASPKRMEDAHNEWKLLFTKSEELAQQALGLMVELRKYTPEESSNDADEEQPTT
jgi:hypothetical protein